MAKHFSKKVRKQGMSFNYLQSYVKMPKATDLLKKHESSEWHLAALEAQGMALLGKKTGNVLDRIIAASDEEKRRNREVIKTLIRSLYFLVKHRVPHTTTFNDLISLQADNGNEIIKQHLSTPSR